MNVSRLACAALLLVSAVAPGAPPGGSTARACNNGADAAFLACARGEFGNFWTANGRCAALASEDERQLCLRSARTSLKEARQACHAERLARRDLCSAPAELLTASERPIFQ